MRPRVSLATGLHWTLRSLEAGAAALGLSVLVFSDSPPALLALLGVAIVVLGGTAWARVRGPWPIRLLVPLGVVILVRIAAGPAAAAVAALLVALGALLRVRVGESVAGLAVFGAAVALLGGASARLVVGVWCAGLAILALRGAVNRARRGALSQD